MDSILRKIVLRWIRNKVDIRKRLQSNRRAKIEKQIGKGCALDFAIMTLFHDKRFHLHLYVSVVCALFARISFCFIRIVNVCAHIVDQIINMRT